MKRTIGSFLAVPVLMLLLSGCGSDSTIIASSNPKNGQKGYVQGTEPIRVTLSVEVDPATVNGSTVTLTGTDLLTGRPVRTPGIVNYDARTRTITYEPTSGFSYNASYSLVLAGLKDTEGNALPVAAVSFTTGASAESFVYDGGGSVITYNSSGLPERVVTYNHAGPDGKWLTGDDGVASYADYTHDRGTRTTKAVQHGSAGTDGVWFTVDDPVQFYTLGTWEDDKDTTITYDGTGGDGLWFTADDTCSWYSIRTFNDDGSLRSETSYTAPGPDGIWFTGDDLFSMYNTYLYDVNGNIMRMAVSRGAGPDGIPFTADDQAVPVPTPPGVPMTTTLLGVSYSTISYDANNRPLTRADYDDPGPDGIWFTADDPYRWYTLSTYDEAGRITRSAASSSPGPDGIPFTTDDSGYYYTYSYTPQGDLQRRTAYWSRGPDRVWFNGDDPIGNYNESVNTTTPNRTLTREVQVYASGPDGVWFTSDDEVSSYTEVTRDGSGRILRRVDFGAGSDGVPQTADDETWFKEEITYDSSGRILATVSSDGPGPDGIWFTTDDPWSWRVEYSYLP